MSDLVTGDAVVLELRPAKLPSRAIAFGIDLLIMSLVFSILLVAVIALLPSLDGTLAAATALATFLVVYVGCPVTVETLTRGRSVGKAAMGLRVVREDGGAIRFRHAFARGLAGLVVDFGMLSGFTGAVAVIASLASARGRRIGDMLAGTLVVRERLPSPEKPNVQLPPQLAGWAEALELSGLPDSLALRVRQFLSRVQELDPPHRAALGAGLAEQVSAHVSPAAPVGTPAEAYLSAVLVARRRREEALAEVRRAAQPLSLPEQRTSSPPMDRRRPPDPDRPRDPERPSEGFVLPG